MAVLDRELETFRRELPLLLKEGYGGQFALIQGDQLWGVWPTCEEALAAGYERFHPDVAFLAREIVLHRKPLYFSRMPVCR